MQFTPLQQWGCHSYTKLLPSKVLAVWFQILLRCTHIPAHNKSCLTHKTICYVYLITHSIDDISNFLAMQIHLLSTFSQLFVFFIVHHQHQFNIARLSVGIVWPTNHVCITFVLQHHQHISFLRTYNCLHNSTNCTAYNEGMGSVWGPKIHSPILPQTVKFKLIPTWRLSLLGCYSISNGNLFWRIMSYKHYQKCLTVKIKVLQSTDMSVTTYQSTGNNRPQGLSLQQQ